MTLKYGSVCSGIEAASCAWHPLGWKAQWLSEIEPFPSAVLAHHYPEVPNLGDMTKFKEWPDAAIDLLVGGTPCQSFSVAGLRKGLADPRGNLMLTYLAIAARFSPRWLVWENVPGVLSSNGGRDFGALLGGLAELGYGFAYRILDAQFFGLAQRRRRVFVVACLGDWRRAAAVLFERESLLGNPPPSRETREDAASGLIGGIDYEGNGHDCGEPTGPLLKGSPTGGGHALPAIARALTTSNQRIDAETETLIVASPIAFDCKSSGQNGFGVGEIASTMRSMGHSNSHQNGGGHLAVAVNIRGRDGGGTAELSGEVATALRASQGGGDKLHALTEAAVRRLTPRECERLQGFTDDYTAITVRNKPAADGPRYKALGNSMAVPVMHWIGSRIQLVEETLNA